MSANIQREAMPAGEVRDHLIPATRVESSCMAKENGRTFARPFKKRDLDAIHGHSALNGHF
jgi:hypothetical protein